MAVNASEPVEQELVLANTNVKLKKAGSGAPLLILHSEMGNADWLKYQQELSKTHTVYMLSHPGCQGSDQPDWIMNMRDLAGWYLQAIEELDITPVDVIGLSFGGWIAAEMAVMSPHSFKKMVLVGAAGVKPEQGEIFDIFGVTPQVFQEKAFFDPSNTPEYQIVCPDELTEELALEWEYARESTCRVSWKPYMYYPGLPNLLSRLKTMETLIIWGSEDAIVPLNSGEIYNRCIKGSKLEIIKQCGHRPEIEKAEEFLKLVTDFL